MTKQELKEFKKFVDTFRKEVCIAYRIPCDLLFPKDYPVCDTEAALRWKEKLFKNLKIGSE